MTFSTYFLDRITSESNPNPIATIFETIRNELEDQILQGHKKRIFNSDEQRVSCVQVSCIVTHDTCYPYYESMNTTLHRITLTV